MDIRVLKSILRGLCAAGALSVSLAHADSGLLFSEDQAPQISGFLNQYDNALNPAEAVSEAPVTVSQPAPPPAAAEPQPDSTLLPESAPVNAPIPRPYSERPKPDHQTESVARLTVDTQTDGPRHSPAKVEPFGVGGNGKGGTFYHSRKEACYASAILKGAKSNVAGRYGNRSASRGQCALGVRTSLNVAGAWTGGGLGNAIDYNARERLRQIGFENFIEDYPNPEMAPPGAVLVFAGPKTQEYLKTGYIGPAGSHGTWVGHVTIKGDDGKYYTDGRTDEPAIGWPKDKNRRKLIGVFLMQDCVSCTRALRKKCGD
jgi:hypothetical protein